MCFFCLFYLLGKHVQVLMTVSIFFTGFQNISRPLFQGCICVERYLAVVHPVTFLRYKLLRYKIMCCSVVWFITLDSCFAFVFYARFVSVLYKVIQGFYVVVFSLMLFCSVSLLWALKQPAPGEGRGQRAEGNDAKRRAFNIIMITTVNAVVNYLSYSVLIILFDYINLQDFALLFNIISSLSILTGLFYPLFYLQRTAKLPYFCFDVQRFTLTK